MSAYSASSSSVLWWCEGKSHLRYLFLCSESVLMGCAAEFCKRNELRMCDTSSWMSYKPTLLQNQLVKYLTDHFGKSEPKRLTMPPQRKSVTEPEIECQSLLFHCFPFPQSFSALKADRQIWVSLPHGNMCPQNHTFQEKGRWKMVVQCIWA